MSDLGFNVWGVVAGVLGTIALIPAFLARFQSRLPSTKLPLLLQSLHETETLFSTAIRDGLFTNEHDLRQFNCNLWAMNTQIEAVSAKVYAAQTWRADVANWLRGLSGRISTLCMRLNEMKMKLADRNSHERKRLLSQGLSEDLPLAFGYKVAGPRFVSYQPQHGMPSLNVTSSSVAIGHLPHHIASDAPSSADHASDDPQSGDTTPQACACEAHHQRLAAGRRIPTHHVISDADLHGLVSFALTTPTAQVGSKGRRAARYAHRRFIGQRSRRIPYETTQGHSEGTHFSAFLRLLRRAYGVRARDVGTASADVPIDPESLTVHGSSNDGSDGDGWEDV